jgi:hypothetical protein
MLCQKCLINNAEPDGSLCQSCRDHFGQYHVHLVLEQSSEFNFGLVKDAKGCFGFVPADAIITGYWQVHESGDLWVTLMSPVQAMQDELTSKITSFVVKGRKSTSTGPKVKKEKKVAIEVKDTSIEDTLSNLRSLFKK